MQVHLDTDIGGDTDDLCALALLLASPDVTITGLTTVLENGGRRAGYARHALGLAGRDDVPIAAGADLQMGYCRLGAELPPEDRYWRGPVDPLPGPLEAALDLLASSIEQGATVVGIGPYTNLALLERRQPGLLRRAPLYLMGGSILDVPPGFPAWDYRMDYNVQADPEAAFLVLAAAEPVMVPLEVTVQTALRRADLPALRAAGRLGQLIAHQAEALAQDQHLDEQYGATCEGLPSDLINFQHDPLACAVALGWPGVTIETLPVACAIEAGHLRERVVATGRPLRVVTSVDQAAFGRFWLETVTRQPG